VSLFAALGGIRRLELLRCVSLTDDGLDALAQLRYEVHTVHDDCHNSSSSGV